MRKEIIIFSLVILIVSMSGCLDTQMTQINQLSEIINEHIKSGNNYFNQAATSCNKYQYEAALAQCNNATAQFELAKTSTQEALIYSKNLQDQVYITYMQITLGEVDAKINATEQLKMAIPLFQTNQTNSANKYVDKANQFMTTSLEFQKQKEELVKQNPTKFKS